MASTLTRRSWPDSTGNSMKILRRILGVLLLLIIVLVLALWLKPPALLRVGANYSAKIVCSNVFLAGRDPDEVLRVDVQAPGIALLRLMQVSVNSEQGVVRAGFLKFIGNGLAQWHPGKGCTVAPDGKIDADPGPMRVPAPLAVASSAAARGSPDALWPDGSTV